MGYWMLTWIYHFQCRSDEFCLSFDRKLYDVLLISCHYIFYTSYKELAVYVVFVFIEFHINLVPYLMLAVLLTVSALHEAQWQ